MSLKKFITCSECDVDSTSKIVHGGLQVVLLIGASLYIAIYLYLAFSRMAYPYELEWNEGRVADHVIRIVNGKALYQEPSLDFMPLGYLPAYYFASVPFMLLLGKTLLPLRVLSFLSSLAASGLVGLFVYRESGKKVPAYLPTWLFLACFKVCGGYYDLARVDSFQLAVLLGALFLLRFSDDWWHLAAGAFLAALAMMTKQTSFFALTGAFLALLLRLKYKGFIVGVLFLCFLMVQLGALVAAYGRWPLYYCIFNKASHPLREGQMWHFWFFHMLWYLTPALLLTLWFLRGSIRNAPRSISAFYLLVFGGMLFASWIGIWSTGGDRNNLLQACAALSIGLGIGSADLLYRKDRRPALLYGVLHLALILQFLLLAYNPVSFIPDKADYDAGREMVSKMRSFEGDIWMPYHGYLPRLAGKRIFASSHDYTVHDVENLNKFQEAFAQEIKKAVREQKFSAIFYDGHFLPETWQRHYRIKEPTFTSPDSYYPPVGYQTRPKAIFVPRREP